MVGIHPWQTHEIMTVTVIGIFPHNKIGKEKENGYPNRAVQTQGRKGFVL